MGSNSSRRSDVPEPQTNMANSLRRVSEFQAFLRDRGVVVSGQRKAELAELCEIAREISLEFDPDGLFEDRQEIIVDKLTDRDVTLPNPSLHAGNSDLSALPFFSVFDVFTYLMSTLDYATVREYQRSEGYTMMTDGYVKAMEVVSFPDHSDYFALKSQVKPRTRDKDPVTGAAFYYPWIIMSTLGNKNRSCILSALCTCKGGIDGCCRHVQATLYEVIDFRDDKKKTSVTSGPCLWVRRATAHQNAVLLTDIVTTAHKDSQKPLRPLQGVYRPVADTSVMASVEDFLKDVKESKPDACMLHVWEVQPKDVPFEAPPLSCATPMERLCDFLKDHVCVGEDCDCAQSFLERYKYTDTDAASIERETRGQRLNKNWLSMRKGLVTASNTKKVLHSTNLDKTANALLKDSSLREEALPAAVEFGRDNEKRALTMFHRAHRYHHRKCNFRQPGLIISPKTPFLGASPDAIFECEDKDCGTFLVEVKCSFKFRNVQPKNALSEYCEMDENNQFRLKPTHDYYHQIQCQMALTGHRKCFLCVYTKKGIETVVVQFDEAYWESAVVKLKQFWKKNMFPKMSAKSGLAV